MLSDDNVKESCVQPTPDFDMSQVVEDLSPDVGLKRYTVVKPKMLIGAKHFFVLKESIPLRFQSSRWRLLFDSEYHGFSRVTMQQKCLEELKKLQDKERPSILMLAAGNKGQILVGAYLSCIPNVFNKKYVGSEESFIFCVPQLHQSLSSSSQSQYDTDLHVFRPPKNLLNRYFLRYDDGAISVGGGGKGPALFLSADFSSVSCSTSCPTFEMNGSLLLFGSHRSDSAASDDKSNVGNISRGVKLEAGEPRATVWAIQLWTISDELITSM